ncbi:MAG: outer membrane beta-barrel family protein [Mariniphaga sp.]
MIHLRRKKVHGIIRLLFVLILISYSVISSAQIQGTVHDSNNQPLGFANVLLINQNDSSLVTGVMVSDVGTFSIQNFKPGKYLIKATMIGYKTTLSQPFEIKSSNDHFHVNPIIAEEETKLISDVSVVAKKPIYEQKIDRMVVNVENSITSSGSTALQILEKSPGIILDKQNKTLSMGGKEGVMVMINGKESRMPVSAAIEMLNGMSAENVQKIELITTPPSKYEAEGNAGIINIVLKKDDDFGTNGNYTLGAGIGVDGKLNGTLMLNHHVKKINYFGSYSYSHDNSYQVISMYRMVNQGGAVKETESDSYREPITIFHNYRLGFDYTISSRTTLGILASGYSSDWEMDANNVIHYKRDNQITNFIDQHVIETNKWTHYMGNINLQHSFKEGEVLDFNLDYLHYDDNNPSGYSINYHDNTNQLTSKEEIKITKRTPINTYVGKLDYTRNFGKSIKLESGLKMTRTSFGNDVSVANLVNSAWTFNSDLTNNYTLSENMSAIYSSLNYKINPKTSMIAGLRYEYTNTVLNTVTQPGIIDRHYGKLFPTLYFSHDLNENNTLQFSYSRRITRPSFNELAPFIVFQSPDTYIAGNEKLQPSLSDIFKTDYKHKSVLLSFSYSIENNAIRRFQPSEDPVKNILYLTSRNLDKENTATLMLSFPLKPAKWWNMQNNLNAIDQKVVTKYDGQNLDIDLKNFNINMINNFTVSKGLSVELSGFYQSPSLWGISKSNAFYSITTGIQMKSKNEKSTFNLNLSDVFLTGIYSFSANVPELDLHNSGSKNFEPQVLRFTYSYNFGSKKVKTERKRETGSDEERKRVN